MSVNAVYKTMENQLSMLIDAKGDRNGYVDTKEEKLLFNTYNDRLLKITINPDYSYNVGQKAGENLLSTILGAGFSIGGFMLAEKLKAKPIVALIAGIAGFIGGKVLSKSQMPTAKSARQAEKALQKEFDKIKEELKNVVIPESTPKTSGKDIILPDTLQT